MLNKMPEHVLDMHNEMLEDDFALSDVTLDASHADKRTSLELTPGDDDPFDDLLRSLNHRR